MSAIPLPRMVQSPSVAGRGVAYLVGGLGAGAAVAIGGWGFALGLNSELVDHSPVAGGGSDAVAAAKDIGLVTAGAVGLFCVAAAFVACLGVMRGVTWIGRGGQSIAAAMAIIRQSDPPPAVRRFAALPVRQRLFRAGAAVVLGVTAAVVVVAFLGTLISDLVKRWPTAPGGVGIGTTLLALSLLGAVVLGALVAMIAERLPLRLVQMHWWWQALIGRGPGSR